jgi:hypothetical protein
MHELDFYYPTPTTNMAQVITGFKRYLRKTNKFLILRVSYKKIASGNQAITGHY